MHDYYEQKIGDLEDTIAELEQDKKVGWDKVAYDCGDTFIDFCDKPPVEQWRRIEELLGENGYIICKAMEADNG